MPLLYVSLVVWHVLSRISILFLFAVSSQPEITSPFERDVAAVLIFNGVSFPILIAALCLPSVFGREISPVHRSTAILGIVLGLLVFSHDVIAGMGLSYGADFVREHFFFQTKDASESLVTPVLIFLIASSMFFAVFGLLILMIVSLRRSARGGSSCDSSISWFPDLR